MKDEVESSRVKQVILEAAFSELCRYGYRRTSMEDIARAAGMSRPALYQHFRNKEDIGRRLIEMYFNRAVEDVTAALASEGAVPDLLVAAFAAKAGEVMRPMMDSPHGTEIIDMKTTQAGDLVAEGMARLERAFAEWLAREAERGRVVLERAPEEEARLLLAALDGVKRPPFDAFVVARDRLARVLGRGLCGG